MEWSRRAGWHRCSCSRPRADPVLGVAVLSLVLLLFQAGGAFAADPIGRVVQQQGAVNALRGEERVPLWSGDPVFVADRILTGSDGRVRIAFIDESELSIGSDSEVIVDDYRFGRDGRRLNAALSLVFGILRAVITPSAPSAVFDVRTRVAVASARATDWVVEAKPGHTAVFVAEGRVAVGARELRGEVLLGAAFGTDVYSGKPPTVAKRWGASRVRDVLERTALQ